jgi:predicted dehydrogenase
MVRVGIAGIGFMGMIHYLAYQKSSRAQVTAICSRDEKKLAGDWTGIQGNFGPPGTQMELGDIARHRTLEALLADSNVDVVDLCLPPAMHAEAAVKSLKGGKHVLCEKPMALTTTEAQKMIKAATAAGKQLMIGHVLPFFPEYAFARRVIASGEYGKFLGGHFKRIIADPLWLKDFYDPHQVGGPVIDLHIHDAHFIRLVCGMPKQVFTRGRVRGDVVEFIDSQMMFDDPSLVVTAASGVIAQQGRPFTHGFEIYLERATLLYDFSVLEGQPVLSMPLTVLSNGSVTRPELGSGDPVDAFVAELDEMAGAIEDAKPSTILGGDLARDALVLCHKQCQSVITGRQVRV